MVNRRRILTTGLLASAAAPAAPAARRKFLGAWKLISYTRTGQDGRVDYPYSERPVGRLTYDSAGRMSGQLMHPGRKGTLPSGVSFTNAATISEEEVRNAVNGFIAYFGTFDVDESTSTVTHHVEASLVPSWVGNDLKRKYKFDGNRLRLTASTSAYSVDLIWEKLPN